MINTILLDMDGTLLPFEQDDFIRMYFSRLCAQLVPFGHAPDDVVKAVWGGTKAMIQNDGSCSNHDRFWDTFAAVLGEDIRQTESTLDRFYTGEFNEVKAVLREESCAKRIVDTFNAKGYMVVLATNPLFPAVAQYSRMAWVGLIPEDFALVTHYDNSRFCKPNLRYYEEILAAIGKKPSECMMIGNSVSEDMVVQALGMETYLVNGYVENPNGADVSVYRQGTLDDLAAFAQMMPSV